ncbi:MAG: hypothetical protein J6W80_03040 [Kiritimatiellae bacterium]|nr:hypothetical protein [Kiritimatiellia bacterium]
MRYHYFYQTSKNENLDGWISAKDRRDAYRRLKRELGIKPYKLVGRDPLPWKLWSAIAALSAVVGLLLLRQAMQGSVSMESERGQLYGDPAMIRSLALDGWRRTFNDPGDAWFARHAIPASFCDCWKDGAEGVPRLSVEEIPVEKGDSPELRRMKMMVNRMKREFAERTAAGESATDYAAFCDRRLVEERGTREAYEKRFAELAMRYERMADFHELEKEWDDLNAELRSMGLPTIPMP